MPINKKCPDCGKVKKLSSFYLNRDFEEEFGHDWTCSECSKKKSQSLDGLKEYCVKNRREFSQELWDICLTDIEEKYKDDSTYNKLTESKKEQFFMSKLINRYFSRQSSPQYYKYICEDNDTYIQSKKSINDDIPIREPEEIESEQKFYSKEWMGTYTQAQLDYLNSYYEDCKDDFVITTRNHKDYARKIAKASLVMDEVYDDYISGKPGSDKRYKEAKAIFDSLSQSAKFSENKRSTNDVAGLGSLSEVVARLEQTGFLQKKMAFEKDDIDKINEDFRWTISSVGGEI